MKYLLIRYMYLHVFACVWMSAKAHRRCQIHVKKGSTTLSMARPQGPEAVVLSGRLRRAFRRTETPDPAAEACYTQNSHEDLEVLEAKRLLESYQDLGGASLRHERPFEGILGPISLMSLTNHYNKAV